MSQNLKSELDRIIKVLKISYQPERIILYGSTVSGHTSPNSDLDVVIVKKTSQRFYDRIGEVLRLVRPKEAVDILVYTPEEYARLQKESWFVGEEIAKKGKVVYAV